MAYDGIWWHMMAIHHQTFPSTWNTRGLKTPTSDLSSAAEGAPAERRAFGASGTSQSWMVYLLNLLTIFFYSENLPILILWIYYCIIYKLLYKLCIYIHNWRFHYLPRLLFGYPGGPSTSNADIVDRRLSCQSHPITMTLPISSMHGICINIGPENHPNVVKYTIHGAYGLWEMNIDNSWLVVSTRLKNISQLGWLFRIYGQIKHVPNHQSDSLMETNLPTPIRGWVYVN